MFAVIVALAILAQAAVLAFRVVGTFIAFGADMVGVVARLDAVAVCAARVFAIGKTASFAEAAIVTDFLTFSFCTVAAFRANPSILFAAVDAMVSASQALLYLITKAEAVLTFGTMVVVILDTTEAQAAFIAHILFASSTVIAMLIVFINTIVAQLMLFATAFESICVLAIYDKTDAAILADKFYAISAVRPRVPAIALLSCLPTEMILAIEAMIFYIVIIRRLA